MSPFHQRNRTRVWLWLWLWLWLLLDLSFRRVGCQAWSLAHVACSARVSQRRERTFAPFEIIRSTEMWIRTTLNENSSSSDSTQAIEFDSLLDMDVVLYSETPTDDSTDSSPCRVGAIQEDGTLAPLSAWTTETAFGDMLELVVDEEDRFPGLTESQVRIVQVLPEASISYGSRQVGGGMGPGNPHGEESELLYYVKEDVLKEVEFEVKPNLEVFW